MTQEHDYKAVLEELPNIIKIVKDRKNNEYTLISFDANKFKAIAPTLAHALKLADKVTGEPSEGMSDTGKYVMKGSAEDSERQQAHSAFKAMIAKAQKDIEDESR